MEQLVNDMGELVGLDSRRRDTFPVRIHWPSVFPTLAYIRNLANAIRLFDAICINFRTLCVLVLILTGLSNYGRLGP
jgi:hypothetical protein